MLQLSDNPDLQKQQLQELVQISEAYLIILTSPIVLFDPVELKQDYLLNSDYSPPQKRFARISYY